MLSDSKEMDCFAESHVKPTWETQLLDNVVVLMNYSPELRRVSHHPFAYSDMCSALPGEQKERFGL